MRSDAFRRRLALLLAALLLIAGLAACSSSDRDVVDASDDDSADTDSDAEREDTDSDTDSDTDRGDDDRADDDSAPSDDDVAEPAGEPQAFGEVTVDGSLGAAVIGEQAPAFTSETSDGTVTIEPGDGTPLAVFFLAHWCPHCQAELPVIVDAMSQGVFDDVEAVAVLTGTNPAAPNFPPSTWLDEEDWTGVRAYDDEDYTLGSAYQLTGFPMMLFIDGEGVVREQLSGGQSVEDLENAVASIR